MGNSLRSKIDTRRQNFSFTLLPVPGAHFGKQNESGGGEERTLTDPKRDSAIFHGDFPGTTEWSKTGGGWQMSLRHTFHLQNGPLQEPRKASGGVFTAGPQEPHFTRRLSARPALPPSYP